VKKLFEKEINNLTKKVDIGNIPAAEINKSQIEYNTAYQKEKENSIDNTQDTTKELTTLKNNLSLDQYLSETDNKIDDVRTRLNFMKR
jgi:chemotaxis regulatin CheY-phosphate phosphatase CheZ